MSKTNKHAGGPLPKEARKLILTHVAGILAISSVLGLAFNASNPIGVRFSSTTAATNAPTNLIVAAKSNAPLQAAKALQLPTPTPPQPASAAMTPPVPGVPVIQPPTPTPGTPEVSAQIPVHATATTWAQVKPELAAGSIVMLDARPKPVYDAGHIPGAISFPEASTPEEFLALKEKYGPTGQLVVYCSSTTCSVSKRVAEKLIQQYGFQSVRFMTGGYEEWLRVEQTKPQSGS